MYQLPGGELVVWAPCFLAGNCLTRGRDCRPFSSGGSLRFEAPQWWPENVFIIKLQIVLTQGSHATFTISIKTYYYGIIVTILGLLALMPNIQADCGHHNKKLPFIKFNQTLPREISYCMDDTLGPSVPKCTIVLQYLVIFRPLWSRIYIRCHGWWGYDRWSREGLKVPSWGRNVWCKPATTSPLIRAVILDPQLIQQALSLLKLPIDANLEAVPGHGARSCTMSEGPASGLMIVIVGGEAGIVITTRVSIHTSPTDAWRTQNASSSCLCWTLWKSMRQI